MAEGKPNPSGTEKKPEESVAAVADPIEASTSLSSNEIKAGTHINDDEKTVKKENDHHKMGDGVPYPTDSVHSKTGKGIDTTEPMNISETKDKAGSTFSQIQVNPPSVANEDVAKKVPEEKKNPINLGFNLPVHEQAQVSLSKSFSASTPEQKLGEAAQPKAGVPKPTEEDNKFAGAKTVSHQHDSPGHRDYKEFSWSHRYTPEYQMEIVSKIYEGVKISVKHNNIVNEEVDAIIDAANNWLAYGGGVAGAIADAGGEELLRNTRDYVEENGAVKTGSAAITEGRFGKLKCQWIIHAVGPSGYGEPSKRECEDLKSAVIKVLELAEEKKLTTLSIPAVASGIFGFPKEKCANIMINAIKEYITKKKSEANKKPLMQEISDKKTGKKTDLKELKGAAPAAIETTKGSSGADTSFTSLKDVRLTNYDTHTCRIFEKEFISQFPDCVKAKK